MPRTSTFASLNRRSTAAKQAIVQRAAFEALEDRRLLSVSIVSTVSGGAGLGNGVAREPSVSANGRYVAFSSTSNNLVAGDTNGVSDIFLRDTSNNTTILISVNTAGAAGNGASVEPSISSDGRFVSFTSSASDLLAAGVDTNLHADIFVRDVQAGTTRRVSADSTGPNFTGNANGVSAEPFTSPDGDFVVFTSRATDMASGVTDRTDATDPLGQAANVNDVFIRDLTSNNPNNAIRMVSVNTTGTTSGNARSFDASVSSGGRFVAFRSDASDLVTGDTNGKRDIFVRDMNSGVTTRVSVATGGGQSNGDSDSPSISEDGRYVVFSSVGTNLAGNDNNNARDVFIHDRNDGSTRLVSVNQIRTASGGGSANPESYEPTISSEGRYVAFTSDASDLVTGDNNNSTDIFLYDVQSGSMTLVSANTAGRPAQGRSRDAFVAPGGQFIAFSSEAIDLVNGDTNGASDAFLATAPDRNGDTVAPTASVSQLDQPSNFIGSPTLDFVVNYNDDVDLAVTSFTNDDIEVSGPGIATPVRAVFVSSVGSGRAAKATYRITAPGGVSEASNGAYTITMRPGQVQDAAGNNVAAGTLGQVNVTAVPAEGPDIVATIPGTLLPQVSGFRGRQRVFIQNTGTQPVAGRITVGLYLSADSLLDPSDASLGNKVVNYRARPNARPRPVAFRYIWPTNSGPNQAFQLLAVADSTNVVAERSEQNNIAFAPVTVAPPFVDLSGGLGPIPTSLVAGQRVRLPFTIQNNGNVPARGAISLKLLASGDELLGSNDTEIITLIKRVSLRPGRPRLMPLSFVMPSTVPAGTYRLLVQIDSAEIVNESNETNNVVASEGTFTVA